RSPPWSQRFRCARHLRRGQRSRRPRPVELDIRGEPFLETILLGKGLPDLLGARLDERLPLDPGRHLVRLLGRCLVSRPHGCSMLAYEYATSWLRVCRTTTMGGRHAAGTHGRRAERARGTLLRHLLTLAR